MSSFAVLMTEKQRKIWTDWKLRSTETWVSLSLCDKVAFWKRLHWKKNVNSKKTSCNSFTLIFKPRSQRIMVLIGYNESRETLKVEKPKRVEVIMDVNEIPGNPVIYWWYLMKYQGFQ